MNICLILFMKSSRKRHISYSYFIVSPCSPIMVFNKWIIDLGYVYTRFISQALAFELFVQGHCFPLAVSCGVLRGVLYTVGAQWMFVELTDLNNGHSSSVSLRRETCLFHFCTERTFSTPNYSCLAICKHISFAVTNVTSTTHGWVLIDANCRCSGNINELSLRKKFKGDFCNI